VAPVGLAAGLLLALSLPPFGLWPLGPLGAALLAWRLGGLRLRTRVWAGWTAGLACYGVGLFWARNFNWYGALVLILAQALALAATAAATPPGPGRGLALAGAATLVEAVRQTWPFGGLPLGGVFLGQADGPLLGLARLGGPLLLTLAVWGSGAALAALAGLAGRPSPGARRRAAWGAAALAGVAAVSALAVAAPAGGPARGRLAVASVQGGGVRGLSRAEVPTGRVFAAQVAATARIPDGRGGLVLWPEDVVALDGALAGSPQGAVVAGQAMRLRATLVAGVTVTLSDRIFLNQAVAWGPSGRVVDRYEKVHRVPFGEYVPFRGFFSHLADLSAVPLDAVPGHGPGVLHTPAGPLGVMVSYEVFYADRGRAAVRAGARLLVVPTNTSSYATGQVPAQEVAADRVQAVAEGRDLLQAAPTGYSTLVDRSGDVLAQSPLGSRAVLLGHLERFRGATWYEAAGDLPVLLVALALLAGGWALALAARRRPGTGPPDA
jgi:apolipoprotein N-acyltransferase